MIHRRIENGFLLQLVLDQILFPLQNCAILCKGRIDVSRSSCCGCNALQEYDNGCKSF